MNGMPLLFSDLPENAVISTCAIGHKLWMKKQKERCTHIREAGTTKTFHFQINLFLS